MSAQIPRSRLFRKYVVFLLLLVGGVLVLSSLVQLYFSFRENQEALARFQREKAVTAAAKIEQFIKEIERQVRGTVQDAFDDPVLSKSAARGGLSSIAPQRPRCHKYTAFQRGRTGGSACIPAGFGC